MSRSELLARIAALSEEEYQQVGPYLEADLEAAERQALAEELRLGRESARSEPLHEHDAVLAEAQALLAKRP